MSAPVRAAIMGGSGYGAGELLRLLTQHPRVEVVSVTTSSHVGDSIAELHPHLRGFYDFRMTAEIDLGQLTDAEQSVVFSALPHGASAAAVEALLSRAGRSAERLRVIDLSGDLRLKQPDLHEQYYPHTPFLPELRGVFQYGLPELFRDEIVAARHVANSGCLATAAILAVAPLVRGDFAGAVVVDAKTGSSGSGRKLKETTHHPTRHANFHAYRPLAHQHEPEVLQALGDPMGQRLRASFVAQSMATSRGIYVTAHLELPAPAEADEITRRFREFYAGAPFVRVVEQPPELQNVIGSNFCDVGVAVRGRQVVAMAALDNLVKGMSGAAIQNMNLMCGLPETSGLWTPAVRPV